MNSTVDISKILILSNLSLLSPNSKIFVIVKSLCLEMFPLTWFTCERRFSSTMMAGAVNEKVVFFFNILTTRDDVRNLKMKWRLSTILKTSHKGVWSNVKSVWRYAKVCIYWKCIQYTLDWDETQMLKKLHLDKINGPKKCPLFFFREFYF